MTQNQLHYQQNAEERRHNLAMESVSQAELPIKEKQAQASLASAAASGLQAQAALSRAATEEGRLAETIRYNKRVNAQGDVRAATDIISGAAKIATMAATMS